MREINVGLLGCGTVGTGVAKILIANRDLISSRVGAALNLRRIADIDLETDRGIRFDEGVLIDDAYKVVDDPDVRGSPRPTARRAAPRHSAPPSPPRGRWAGTAGASAAACRSLNLYGNPWLGTISNRWPVF